jgi:aryl-alcohol dehydrogenase-like predicted oxidoreductase
LVVAWTLAAEGVTSAICGARNPMQVEGWIGASDVRFDDDIADELAFVIEERGFGD